MQLCKSWTFSVHGRDHQPQGSTKMVADHSRIVSLTRRRATVSTIVLIEALPKAPLFQKEVA